MSDEMNRGYNSWSSHPQGAWRRIDDARDIAPNTSVPQTDDSALEIDHEIGRPVSAPPDAPSFAPGFIPVSPPASTPPHGIAPYVGPNSGLVPAYPPSFDHSTNYNVPGQPGSQQYAFVRYPAAQPPNVQYAPTPAHYYPAAYAGGLYPTGHYPVGQAFAGQYPPAEYYTVQQHSAGQHPVGQHDIGHQPQASNYNPNDSITRWAYSQLGHPHVEHVANSRPAVLNNPVHGAEQTAIPPIVNNIWNSRPAVLNNPANNADQDAIPPAVKNIWNSSPKTVDPQRKEFKPMAAIANGGKHDNDVTPEEKLAAGYSPNYMGNIHNTKNRSAPIPEEQSTSLYLRKLPPNTTAKMILDYLSLTGPYGKVHSIHVSPGGPGHTYPFCAAKLAMFTRAAAEKIFNFIEAGNMVIQGHRVIVTWNRQLVAETKVTSETPAHLSRVLLIKGPRYIVNYDTIKLHLDVNLFYSTQDVMVLPLAENDEMQNLMVWTFGSCDVQTTTARMAIMSMWENQGVRVRFGTDPVEVGVAEALAENIRGGVGVPVAVAVRDDLPGSGPSGGNCSLSD